MRNAPIRVACLAVIGALIVQACSGSSTATHGGTAGGAGEPTTCQLTGVGGAGNVGGWGDSCGACKDDFGCTYDACFRGACTHFLMVPDGLSAEPCPTDQYCTLDQGCVPDPSCATVADCVAAWGNDPCKVDVRCENSKCKFALLDADADGEPPVECGGTDCNDHASIMRGPPYGDELCDGIDNDCDGVTDNFPYSICGGNGNTCECGECVCHDPHLCSVTGNVAEQPDAR